MDLEGVCSVHNILLSDPPNSCPSGAQYIHPIPIAPKVLTHPSINSKSKVLFTYHLNLVWVRLYVRLILRQNSLLAVNPWDERSYVLPKHSGRTDTGLAI